MIVRKRGERAGLEDTNLQTGLVHVDRLGLGVELVWSEADNDCQNSQRQPRKSAGDVAPDIGGARPCRLEEELAAKHIAGVN